MGDKQFDYYFAQSFAYGDYEQSTAKKYTRLYLLLVEFEAVAQRKEQVDVIKPHLPQAQRQRWAAPYPLEIIMVIHLLLQLYDLKMQHELNEVVTMRRFTGVALITDRIPERSTTQTFRNLLEKHLLAQGLP